MADFTLTPVIRAHLDLLEVHGNLARARGWIFRPDIAGESVDINLNGLPWVTSLRLFERDDVRLHFERTLGFFWSHTLRCGFDVTYELPPGATCLSLSSFRSRFTTARLSLWECGIPIMDPTMLPNMSHRHISKNVSGVRVIFSRWEHRLRA